MSKVYHLNDLEEFFGADDWKLTIDVTDIWNQYNKKGITFEQFNTEYYNRLVKYKSDIVNLGEDIWTTLQPLIVKLNETKDIESITSVYEDLYDWADKSDILIKTK